MNNLKSTFILLGLLVTTYANAQKSPENLDGPNEHYFRVSVGVGTANYYGDLIKKSGLYTQASYSFSGGVSYSITNKLAARLDIGMHRLQGSDSKKGGAHPDRNLNFKSNTFDFTLSGEYTIFNLEKFPVSPYLRAGIGVVLFNPFTTDANGRKQSLPELNTEGQGLPGFKKPYNTAALEFPIGIGVKYPFTEKLALALEFNYNITRTDYLDDVSTRYPDKALLDARNPLTSQFSYRGAGPYPKNMLLPRGNPDDNDIFFTTQIKLSMRL